MSLGDALARMKVPGQAAAWQKKAWRWIAELYFAAGTVKRALQLLAVGRELQLMAVGRSGKPACVELSEAVALLLL